MMRSGNVNNVKVRADCPRQSCCARNWHCVLFSICDTKKYCRAECPTRDSPAALQNYQRYTTLERQCFLHMWLVILTYLYTSIQQRNCMTERLRNGAQWPILDPGQQKRKIPQYYDILFCYLSLSLSSKLRRSLTTCSTWHWAAAPAHIRQIAKGGESIRKATCLSAVSELLLRNYKDAYCEFYHIRPNRFHVFSCVW